MARNPDPKPDPFIGKMLSGIGATRDPRRFESNRMIGGTETQQRATCKVFNNANVTMPNTTVVVLPWNSEAFDFDGLHNPAVNTRLTIPGMIGGGSKVTGLWLIYAHVTWQADLDHTGALRVLNIRKNGATVIRDSILHAPPVVGAAVENMTQDVFTYEFEPVAGDYYEITATQTNTGAAGNELIIGALKDSSFEMIHVW